MPCCFDAELLGEYRDLACGTESSNLRNMNPDLVDQLFCDERLPFMRAVEELPHGDGRCAILANLAEVTQVLRRQRVFQKVHSVLLGLFAKLDGLIRREALMHIVE